MAEEGREPLCCVRVVTVEPNSALIMRVWTVHGKVAVYPGVGIRRRTAVLNKLS